MSTFEEELERHGNLVYTNVGPSMLPLIREGRDLLMLEKPSGRLKRYDVPLYKRDNGQYILHRILRVREHDYVTCGDNQWKPEYGIEDRQIIGRLCAIVRDGKTIRVNAPLYQIYVHLWCDLFFLRAAILWVLSIPGRIRRKWRKEHPQWNR